MSTGHQRSRFSDALFAHTIRLIEEDGPLEDSAAMQAAFRTRRGREERLIARATVIGERLKLGQELERWRTLAAYGALALSALVFFIAYGIAVAVIGGDRSVNAVLAFLIVLGMHAFTLVLWCISTVLILFSQARASSRLSLGALLLRLVAWLPLDRGQHAMSMMRAANGLLQREKLAPWAFGFVSHTIWALAFLLVLVALSMAFSFQAYRLTWETTILSPDFFVDFVRLTGAIPQWIGFPVPDSATLRDPAAPGSDHRAWAWWLIGSTLVYGLIPRVLFAGISWIGWRRGVRRMRIDTTDPYFRKLLARFDAMEASTVVDPERRSDTVQQAIASGPVCEGGASLAVIGFELPPESEWPPGPLAQSAQLVQRISGSSGERRTLLNRLAESRPARLLVCCNAGASPDRGTERFLREAAAQSGHCGVLLLGPASIERAARWQSWLSAAGMAAIPVFTDVDGAANWFKASHD